MRDDDPGQTQRSHGLVDAALAGDVEMAGRLVEHQYAGLAVQGSRQQDALLLAPGEHRAHVAHERVVLHRHRDHVVMYRSQAGARCNAGRVRNGVEEADVLADGPSEELVVLHHAGDHAAPLRQAHPAERPATHFDAAGLGLQQAEQQLDERRLAAPRRPDDGDRFALLNAQVQLVQDPRIGFRITERHPLQLDAATRQFDRHLHGIGCILGGVEHDVADTFGVQAEHAQLQGVLHQRSGTLHELGLVGNEREQHADGEAAAVGHVEHQQAAEPKRDDVLDAEQGAVQRLINQTQPLDTNASIELVDHQVLPAGAALLFTPKQLDALHAPHAFEKVALLACAAHDLLFGGQAQRAVERDTQRRVQARSNDRHRRQSGAVGQHHCQRGQGHHAVDQPLQKTGRQGALQGFQGVEFRHHIAHMTLVEPGHRQPDQMSKQVRHQLQIHRRAQHHEQPGAQRGDPRLHQRKQQEADAQHRDQVTVLRDQGVVDDPLHVKRSDQRKHLQRHRQQQHLHQCTTEARRATDQG